MPLLAETTDVVRAVVISDIHCTEDGTPNTNVAQSKPEPHENALVGAKDFLAKEIQTADLVICPGDLVHMGEIAPTDWAWGELNQIANTLQARIVGAVGNHDLLREPQAGQHPAGALRDLIAPRFPLADFHETNNYWSNDFGVLEFDHCRIVTMNTCSMHGGFDESASGHGQFRKHTLRELEQYLAQLVSGPSINVCVVHHHPVEWTHHGDELHGHLRGGDLLINLLDGRPEHWLVVSGHKHHPSLGYLGRSTNGPAWLAAGSIGADVLTDTGTTVRNQLHVVDIATNPGDVFRLQLAAEIHSYDWEPGAGWAAANARSGLPGRAGIGFRRDALELVADLRDHLAQVGSGNIRWPEIVAWDSRWAYLTPDDRNAMLSILERAGGGVTGHEDDETLELTLP